MTELEMCNTLGLLLDPEVNRVLMTEDVIASIRQVSQAFAEVSTQKRMFGTVNPDLWLEFIPWHSIN